MMKQGLKVITRSCLHEPGYDLETRPNMSKERFS